MTHRILPSQEELNRLFFYNPDTGELLWRERPGNKTFNKVFAGKLAGGLSSGHGRPNGSHRYLEVAFGKPKFHKIGAHRLIWKIMTGEEPPSGIDHKDGDELNLRWNNLRSATNGQNLYNSKRRIDNSSGIKGVGWHVGHKKWDVRIMVNKKSLWLGRASSLEEAAMIIKTARTKLHGEFARHE